MYESHWGLQQTPFRACLDPTVFYESPTHEEALARMDFLVQQRRRLGLLMGDSGSGKSLLMEVFAGQCRQAGRVAVNLSLLGLQPTEFFWSLGSGLGLNLHPGGPLISLWQAVADQITGYRYQRFPTVLLLDDADRAAPDVLAFVRRLAQHDLAAESYLTMVLAGRARQIGRLGESLVDLAELRIDVERWDLADTEHYLEDSLRRAGQTSPLFDTAAIARLHELADGIPRRVGQLADLALAAGAGQDCQEIDAQTVEAACHELGVVEVS